MRTLLLLLLPLAAMAAEPAAPAVELEPVDRDPAWRLSIGLRAAPGIKTSAAVDARAAATAAGAVLRPSGGSSSGKAEVLGTTTEGTTAAEAQKEAGWSEGKTRWDFDNGFIDMNDGAGADGEGIEGETQNWHFDSAEDFVDGAIQARTPFSRTTTTRTRRSAGTSVREEWGEDLRVSSDETACGFELRLDRTVWENADFGLDVGVGYAWYDDVDAFSVRGRAYDATAASVSAGETVTTTEESGTVVTSLAQPEFEEPADYTNSDDSMGGAVEDPFVVSDGTTEPIPILTVSKDRFSSSVEKTESRTTTKTTGGGGRSSSRTTRRTVDVRSEGTLSLQELRFGARPFWKAAPWLAVRADLGLLATYSEIETTTRLSVDGAPAAAIRRDDDDWTLGGYAGASLDLAATDSLTLSVGAEARFPHKSIRFDDGVVSGKADLAEWSAFAALGWRF